MNLKDAITKLYNEKQEKYSSVDRELFDTFIEALDSGEIRACEKKDTDWQVNQWVKMGILIGFRMGVLTEYQWSENKSFFDKDTLPEKVFQIKDQIRIVPGGTSIRKGSYIAKGVTIMPPAFVNIGAYVDSGTLIDSHALVGSCAQIGKNVHLSAGAMIGGVLEPIEARPVVVEDDAFIGGNAGIYQGIIIKQKAVIAAGTIITASTLIYDSIQNEFLQRDAGGSFTIPERALVVPGSRSLKDTGFQLYCPIIVKYRDAKTDESVKREKDLHIFD